MTHVRLIPRTRAPREPEEGSCPLRLDCDPHDCWLEKDCRYFSAILDRCAFHDYEAAERERG